MGIACAGNQTDTRPAPAADRFCLTGVTEYFTGSLRLDIGHPDHLGPPLGFRKAALDGLFAACVQDVLRSLDMSYFPVDGLVSGIRSQRIAALSRPTDAILRNAAVRPKLIAIKPKSAVLSAAPIPDAVPMMPWAKLK